MKRCSFVVPFLSFSIAATAPAWSQSTGATPQTSSSQSSQTSPAASSQLKPRGPEASAQQDPNHIVAKIGDKDITAKQALDILQTLRVEDRKRYENNLAALVQQIYMEDQLASQAIQMKLDQQSPWKEQLKLARSNILTQAYLSQPATGGASDDPKSYYDAHGADFDQVKLSGILVAFNPPGTPANSGAMQRTEAAAKEKADDLEKKIKAGGDFSAIARTDSDNQQSSVRGGDLGQSAVGNLPPAIKDRVLKMQPGEVSEPIQVPGGYYILKLDSKSRIPFETARPTIVQKQQNDKAQAALKQQMDRYKIQVQDPNFFNASSGTSAPASRVPSLAHPATSTQPPVFAGGAISLELGPQLQAWRGQLLFGGTRGKAVYAASFIRERRIVLATELVASRDLFRSILLHELFHFAWVRLGNQRRNRFAELLQAELKGRARGELGESAEVYKAAIFAESKFAGRRWRDYCCESFCDSGASLLVGPPRGFGPVLSRCWRERRFRWLAEDCRGPFPV